jgi:serine protease AprX
MKKYFSLLILIVLCLPYLHAETGQKYMVYFKDKKGVSFDPYRYFDAKAIERRIIAGLPLYDSTDFPVNQNYIKQIAEIADSVYQQSRWMNGVCVFAGPEQISRINKLSFVLNYEPLNYIGIPASTGKTIINKSMDTAILRYQVRRLRGNSFRDKEITGKGVRIAVFDVGFSGVDVHPAFKHIRDNKRILLSWDFIKNAENVYGYGTHGTSVLSCIAGKYDTINMGMAPDAEFLLARTERMNSEWRDEEVSWLAAAEWADKNGAQIISSSLGYTYLRYFYKDMDGKTSLVARAATMAARKGILVVTAAGNEGTDSWKYLATPGDADSVLTIGATDPFSGYKIGFSSFGPTADGRLKPNVSAPGFCFVATKNNYAKEYGTSFSTPLVAGFAACAWQMNPAWENMKVYEEIEKSGHLYPYFDYVHGYGIPQADYFTQTSGKKEVQPSFVIDSSGTNIIVILKDSVTKMSEAEKKASLLYYHFADQQGIIKQYYVVRPAQQNILESGHENYPAGWVLRIHYKGYTQEIKL